MCLTPNSATMSVAGLYHYDNSLFDNLNVPDDVNKTTIVDNIVLECAELELLYPDFDFLKKAIGTWSAKELPTWAHIASLASYQYNPIENYDRYDSEVITGDRGRETLKNELVSAHVDGTGSGENKSVQNSDDTNKVAGFNTDTLSPNSQAVGKTDVTDNSTSTTKSSNNSVTSGKEKEKEVNNNVRTLRSHGNIGVTTVAQMMAGDLETYPKINIVNYIVNSFKNRFCILIY